MKLFKLENKIKDVKELIGKYIKIYSYCFYDLKFLERNNRECLSTMRDIEKYKKDGVILYVDGDIEHYKVEVVLLKKNENYFMDENGKKIPFEELCLKRKYGRLNLYKDEFSIKK